MAIFPSAFNIGLIGIFLMGKYVNYFVIPLISIFIICVFLLAFYTVHDPPKYLYSKNRVRAAEKSNSYYNGENLRSSEIESMIEMRKPNEVISNTQIESLSIKDFRE